MISRELRDKARKIAAHLLEAAEDDLEWEPGRFVVRGSPDRAATILGRVNETVVQLSSPEAAELAKLLENIFRTVNIALVNELAMLCDHLGLDVWEVIDGAATKPFGFMPFRPGPGVGGHCIAVDPWFIVATAPDCAHGFPRA